VSNIEHMHINIVLTLMLIFCGWSPLVTFHRRGPALIFCDDCVYRCRNRDRWYFCL